MPAPLRRQTIEPSRFPAKAVKYRDLDLDFSPHPVTGKLLPLVDVDAVKRSVRNLVLTNNYERPFRPEIGANITAILFNPGLSPITARQLETAIEDVIRSNEKRAELISVKANLDLDRNGFDVEIIFSVKTIAENVSVDMFLKRTR